MKTLYFKHKKKASSEPGAAGIYSFWQLEDENEQQVGSIHSRTKTPALRLAKAYCREKGTKEDPILLRISKKNAQFQIGYVYPKSANPRKSKG